MKEQLLNLKNLTYNALYDYLKSLDIDIIGMAYYHKDDEEIKKYHELLKIKKENNKLYLRNNMDSKDYTNLDKVIDNPKTIISIGLNYNQEVEFIDDNKIGYYAKISYGIDYHIIMNELLDKITSYLKEYHINSYVSCDTKVIDDKFMAYYCGNGFYGKNNLLINEEYGSEVVYATIVIDYYIDNIITNRIESKCDNCFKCEAYCPTASIIDYKYNYLSCMAYLTQSTNMINLNYINKYFYSWDICSNNCPYNKISNKDYIKDIGYYNLEEVILMNKEEFNRVFKNKSLTWLNYNIIKKNALLLYANKHELEDILILEKKYLTLKQDSSLMIKAFSFIKKQKEIKNKSKLKNNIKRNE